MVSLPLFEVREYCFAKHHISPNNQGTSIVNIAKALVGLHSARLPTPYIAIYNRIDNFLPEQLRQALLDTKVLIKIRCMRRTLHIFPLDLAPIAHQATLNIRSTYMFDPLSEQTYLKNSYKNLQETILRVLNKSPLSINQIQHGIEISEPNLYKKLGPNLIKITVRDMWERGELCYLNVSSKWDSESRLYGVTKSIYPTLNLDGIDISQAQEQLIHLYIQRFGPVSIKDICWWSGLAKKIVERCLKTLSNRLLEVQILDTTEEVPKNNVFYMTKEDYNAFCSNKQPNNSWLKLLAYEDPTLKGYFESRWRYVSMNDYGQLFNQIGEARPSIAFNGKIIGIWSWDKKHKKIIYRTFRRIDLQTKAMIEEASINLEDCLRTDFPQCRQKSLVY